jgi:hypothetical protein
MCTADMLRRGIDQWDDRYPTLSVVEQDARMGHLHVTGQGVCTGRVSGAGESVTVFQSATFRRQPGTLKFAGTIESHDTERHRMTRSVSARKSQQLKNLQVQVNGLKNR